MKKKVSIENYLRESFPRKWSSSVSIFRIDSSSSSCKSERCRTPREACSRRWSSSGAPCRRGPNRGTDEWCAEPWASCSRSFPRPIRPTQRCTVARDLDRTSCVDRPHLPPRTSVAWACVACEHSCTFHVAWV